MKDIREILDAHLEGELPPDEQRQLRDWLRADRGHVRQFVREMHAHQALREHFVADSLQREAPAGAGLPAPGALACIRAALTFGHQSWAGIVWATAAVAVLVGGIVLFREQSSQTEVALLESPAGLVVERNHKPVAVAAAASLEAGDVVQTPPGHAAVVGYRDGSRVELKGGGRLTYQAARSGGKTLLLQEGQLRAVVAKQPRKTPMTVRTPEAEVTVLGTEFRLTSARGMTHLEVLTGAVAIRGLSDGRVTTVRGGESFSTGGATASRGSLTLPVRGTPEQPVLLLKLGKSPVPAPDGSRVAAGAVVAHEDDDYVATTPDDVVVARRGFGRWKVSFRFPLDPAPAPGDYVLWASWRQGGEPKVSDQTFELWAGPTASALEKRGTARLTNPSPWKFQWVHSAQALALSAGDRVIEVRNSGQAHDAKVFQAFLLAPVAP